MLKNQQVTYKEGTIQNISNILKNVTKKKHWSCSLWDILWLHVVNEGNESVLAIILLNYIIFLSSICY